MMVILVAMMLPLYIINQLDNLCIDSRQRQSAIMHYYHYCMSISRIKYTSLTINLEIVEASIFASINQDYFHPHQPEDPS